MRRALPLAAALSTLAAAALYLLLCSGQRPRLVIATTTSLYQTGLLDALAEAFNRTRGAQISILPLGSGEALEKAAKGDACLVLVHAPSLEARYLADGSIYGHVIFAYNFFVLVGPVSDPAGVSRATSASEAFKMIYRSCEGGGAGFISRGDYSGTHVKELQLWRGAGLEPLGKPWYKDCGCGMAQALVMADNLGAYTLSDAGTFLKLRREGRISGLDVLYSNSTELVNIYSLYLSARCSGSELSLAKEFASFVAGSAGQEVIGTYGVAEYGQPLFHPAAGNEEKLLKAWEILSKGWDDERATRDIRQVDNGIRPRHHAGGCLELPTRLHHRLPP